MWEALVVRGVAAILFGVAAVFWPGLTLVTLVYIVSIYILISGVIGIVQSILGMTRGQSWFLSMIIAIAELGVGLYLVRNPEVTFATFILVLGFVLIARGVLEVVIALVDEKGATNKMLLIIGGVLSAIVGTIILLQPASGGVAFVWVLGLYALITGPIMVALGLDAKKAIEGSSKK
jgi:uncharacterized membrane protein HdeD (DUF308 family)